MKIIKLGKVAPKEYKLTCSGCRTQFVANEHEGTIEDFPREGPTIKFKCPGCGKMLYRDVK